MPCKRNIIIIGAGLSGLSCGSALKEKALILEKQNHIGGLAATKKFRGFSFDLGGHRFFTDNPSTEKFFKGLLKGNYIEVERKSKIYRNGSFVEYPIKASVVFQLNPLDIAASFLFYIYRKAKPLKEFSFEERSINRFGDHLYKLFFKDYTKKVWGADCNKISKELVDARLQKISLMRVIKHVFIHDKSTKSFTDKFIYPRKGINILADSLAEGLDIRLNKKVTGLACHNNTVEKIIVNNSEEIYCENIISTMPLTELIKLLNPPHEISDAAGGLRYRSLICVFLILNKKNHTRDHWVYFPDGQMFGRLHEPKNWSPDMAPAERTGVCLEIFCDRDDTVWNMPDKEIAHQVIRDMPLVGRFDIKDHFVVRAAHAYPVYNLDYKENIKKIKQYLSYYKNLFLLGRTGSFRYINMDTCIEDGLKLGHFLADRTKTHNPAAI